MQKTTPNKLKRGTFVLLSLAALTLQGYSQKINWGNAANDINVDSAGNPLTDATFTFELGVFSNGEPTPTEFTPTSSNIDFWGDNWVALDTAAYNQEGPPTPEEGFFSDSWIVPNNPNNTYEGFRAYIWVYNNQAGDETSEWVLITDDGGSDEWLIPASNGTQQTFPQQFRVSNASTSLYGDLNLSLIHI